MSTEVKIVETQPAAEAQNDLANTKPLRIPQYRRDIFPKNIVLSAEDIKEFCQLLNEVNEKARILEYNSLDLSGFESPEQARDRVNEFVQIEYNYLATNGDSVQGLGIPKTDEYSFPDDLKSMFVSNVAYAQRAIKVTPLNAVEAFIGFDKPSLKIDIQSMPSNPSSNRSVINVSGRDEDWVISTTDRIQNFFKKRQAFRPVIHGSGTYDYFVYLIFLPVLLWLFYHRGEEIANWLENKSIFLNVILGIYTLLLSLLVAQFVFKYIRWLFPPMEYYKKSRIGWYVHRTIATTVMTGLALGAARDVIKGFVLWLF
ncbi:hypothetical protein [Rhizobium sp. NPDC090279]|uniref:hypothetical protein n=1 Tax=Rhizobium sp. NPDC090279 TaxID=3364499 RepID=UPI00383A0457